MNENGSSLTSDVGGLEKTLEILSTEVSHKQKLGKFWKECKDNFPLEWKCVVACEAGDIVGTYSSLVLGATYYNLAGYASGVGAGLLYAGKHITEDAKAQGLTPSKKDIVLAVGSAEVACTFAATAVPAILGNFFGISLEDSQGLINEGMINFDVLKSYFVDLAVRGFSLIPAIPVGMVGMSALTFPKKSEVARFVSGKGASNELYEIFHSDMRALSNLRESFKGKYFYLNVHPNEEGNKVTVCGRDSNLVIKEKPLPEIYRDKFNRDENSLYSVISPLVKYHPELKEQLFSYVADSMKRIGRKFEIVENPFNHDHSHKH